MVERSSYLQAWPFWPQFHVLSNYQSRTLSVIMKVVYDPKKEMSFKTELFDKWLHVGAKQYTISARKALFFNNGDHFEEVKHNYYLTHARDNPGRLELNFSAPR